MKVSGTPLGHPQFVRRFLSQLCGEAQGVAIPWLDVRSAWLLLAHSAAEQANYSLCCVEPQDVELFARAHAINMRQCLSQILRVNLEGELPRKRRILWQFPLVGAQECFTDEQGCLLGQLGRLLGHDQRTPKSLNCWWTNWNVCKQGPQQRGS